MGAEYDKINARHIEVRQAGYCCCFPECKCKSPGQQAISKQCKGRSRHGSARLACMHSRESSQFTVGTVFILVSNQAAGESSLVEALVTTRCALWHVRVLENHRLRAAQRNGETVKGRGAELDGWGRWGIVWQSREEKERHKHPRRAEAESGA